MHRNDIRCTIHVKLILIVGYTYNSDLWTVWHTQVPSLHRSFFSISINYVHIMAPASIVLWHPNAGIVFLAFKFKWKLAGFSVFGFAFYFEAKKIYKYYFTAMLIL